jgi:hypothetical protein
MSAAPRLARPLPILSFALLAGLAASCAEGGVDNRLSTEVQTDVTGTRFDFFGIAGPPSFPFPLTVGQSAGFDGRLLFDPESQFRITNNAVTVASGRYSVQQNGVVSLLFTGSGQSTLWQGAFGLEGDTDRIFVADRIGNVGLYLGNPVVDGPPDASPLEGTWTVLSMHALFPSASLMNPTVDDVARAFAGSIVVPAPTDAMDLDLDFTGSGEGSAQGGSPVAFPSVTGTVTAVAGSEFDLSLSYGASTPRAETRSYTVSGGDGEVLFGVENGASNTAEGLIALIKNRTAPVDLTTLAGDWLVGVWTIFPLPTRSGFDAGVGTATIDTNGDYFVDANNNTGTRFTFSGRMSTNMVPDGQVSVTEARFNETWIGAVDESQNTIVILDDRIETRANGESPELNLLVLLRRP